MLFFKIIIHYFKMWNLVIVAIFKNEAHILDEWLTHYRNEGVDHFYLINNDSSDDYQSQLQKHFKYITLVHDRRKNVQIQAYNQHFLGKVRQNTWMMVVDLDEFVYARKGFSTIAEYLKIVPKHVTQILIPWKIFGSNGHLTHPVSAIEAFTQRALYYETESPNLRHAIGGGGYKSITRVSKLRRISQHLSEINGESYLTYPTTQFEQLSKPHPWEIEYTEATFENHTLHLNHYRIQSAQFVENKINRGDVLVRTNEKLRTKAYFQIFDRNELTDTELRDKTRKVNEEL